MPKTEFALIEQVKAGDFAQFELLYRSYKRRIFSLCLRMTDDYALAEDFTQEAFITAFRRIDSFRGDSAFSTWLHRIAVNIVLMHVRQQKSRGTMASLDDTASDEDVSMGERLGREDRRLSSSIDRVSLESAINRLAPGYRIVLVLHDIEGYEHSEIAELMGCSVGNTKSQLHKARLRLRELLSEASELSNNGRMERARRTAA
jgi:RNA polymerase sigma-70 factor, ECF subfamily